MVKRALDLKVVFDKIILANEFSDLNNIKLSQSDWTSLENIAAFLWCFAKLSTEMCVSKYSTISVVYPIYYLLMGHAEKKMNKDKTPNNIALAANAAWNKLYEFTRKFDEYCSIYYPVSGTLNNSLGKDEDSEDSLFPVSKRFRNNNGMMSSIVTLIVLQNQEQLMY
ncbi:unnamed protein product [Rhizophagus irregularis]|nr:unnamed protein product [Rhizophagus irregularis]